MARIILIKPDHRCQKCKTPLDFMHNYMRSEKEIDEIVENQPFWKLLISSSSKYNIDFDRQYWHCPKCNETYLIDKRNVEVKK